MKILHVIPRFDPPWTCCGTKRVAYDTTKKLTEKGNDLSVYTSNAHDVHSRKDMQVKDIDGIKVHFFRKSSSMVTRNAITFITPEMISEIKRRIHNFDVVHIHGYRNILDFIVSHYAKKYSIPYVLQAHGSLPRIMLKKMLGWTYDGLFGYRLLRGASKVIALNQMEVNRYMNIGISKEKVACIPNGLDLKEYTDLPPKGYFKEKFDTPKDKEIILYLGRIHKTKGLDLLVKAYAHLTKNIRYNGAVLVITGPEDGYLAKLNLLISSLGVNDTVLFTGFVSNEDKLKVLVDSNIFTTPYFYGFPVTFLEACAIGTPIITTTMGDTLEWIDGNVGYVVLPKIRALAEAIHKVISNDETHEKFSRNCREIVKSKFSLAEVVDRLEQVYREVAGNRA